MSNQLKKQSRPAECLTAQQRHIKELRAQLNKPDPDEIQPFTLYKIITYLFVLILPLVPVALYRIWWGKSEFSSKEQKIWTAVIAAIAVYMAVMAFS